jgi:hypothetical protein
MSDITVFQQAGLPATNNNDAAFAAIAKSGDYLKRVQLFGSNSKEVKAGKFPMAHYGLVHTKDNIEDIGATFDTVACAWRPKAMRIADKGIENYHNQESAEFQKIVDSSGEQDSGCMYGPEFLLWLPQQKIFAGMFFNNPTMRRAAPALRQLLQKAATLKAQFIEKGKFSWHGPVIVPCTTPLANVPDIAELTKQVEKFTKPKDSEVETVDTTNQRAR